MGGYRLSETADSKLTDIYLYSFEQFGEAQADAYLLGLHRHFALIADNPKLGRDSSDLLAGLRRLEFKSHVVFYQIQKGDVLIVDVFGKRQIPFLPGGG